MNDVTDEWQRVTVPLNIMNGITDWTDLEEFAISFHSRRAEIKQGAYYIDDIALIKTGRPGPHISDRVDPKRKLAWEQALGGKQAAKPHIHARLTGWPQKLLVDKKNLPKGDREFLLQLARGYMEGPGRVQ